MYHKTCIVFDCIFYSSDSSYFSITMGLLINHDKSRIGIFLLHCYHFKSNINMQLCVFLYFRHQTCHQHIPLLSNFMYLKIFHINIQRYELLINLKNIKYFESIFFFGIFRYAIYSWGADKIFDLFYKNLIYLLNYMRNSSCKQNE